MTIRCARPLKNEKTYAVTFDSLAMNTTKVKRNTNGLNIQQDTFRVRNIKSVLLAKEF